MNTSINLLLPSAPYIPDLKDGDIRRGFPPTPLEAVHEAGYSNLEPKGQVQQQLEQSKT